MFRYDERLGISVPALSREWRDYTRGEQQQVMHKWEMIRGLIPERIYELEKKINEKQAALNDEDDFSLSCLLNTEISELASVINDLWLWFRTVPDLNPADGLQKMHS